MQHVRYRTRPPSAPPQTLPGESPNDRNDRAIRRAAKWYAEHLAGKGINVVLLSDDADNRAKAEGEMKHRRDEALETQSDVCAL